MRGALTLVVALAVALAGAGCGREPNRPPSGTDDLSHAIDLIARARAEREQVCGSGRASPDRLAALRVETSIELSPRVCTTVLRGHALAACVDRIRRTPCGSDVDDLGRVSECRVGAICDYAADEPL